METTLFECRELAQKIQEKSKTANQNLFEKTGKKACLAVVLVGEDPASQVYVRMKGEACSKLEIEHRDVRLSKESTQEELEKVVADLNADSAINAILVQSPLPKQLDELAIQRQISPAKDVDCFHPENVGNLYIDTKHALEKGLAPCTPAGVIEVLKENNIETRGKHAVVVGRSNIVGKPLAQMLLALDATVKICHSKTQKLEEHCKQADILIAAVGRPELLNNNHVKEGAAVIDVGVNRIERDGKNKLVGDVDRNAVMNVASFLTPVPKGIGPMTIAMLMRNTVRAAFLQNGLDSPV